MNFSIENRFLFDVTFYFIPPYVEFYSEAARYSLRQSDIDSLSLIKRIWKNKRSKNSFSIGFCLHGKKKCIFLTLRYFFLLFTLCGIFRR